MLWGVSFLLSRGRARSARQHEGVSHNWTTPDALRAQIEKRWQSGELLAAYVWNTALFPLALRLRVPSPREVAERFGDVSDWVRRLQQASRAERGFGFELSWKTVRNRVQGSNALPTGAWVPSASDALRLIGREQEAKRFEALAAGTLARYPELREWLRRRPLTALDHAADWPRVLAVLDWFVAHPRPGLYLRQLDIPGVDSKFIQAHRGLIGELLDAVLPAHAIDATATGMGGFAQRYGLCSAPALVRFRVLDPALAVRGLRDISVPIAELAQLQLPVKRVLITENQTNGLACPEAAESLVIFGLGYGVEGLGRVPWLQDVEVWYWGDIDTHGFAILRRLRQYLPHTRSLLMDRETLLAHRALWGEEAPDKRYTGPADGLSADEATLLIALQQDQLGTRVRLEQERIRFGAVERAIAAIGTPGSPS